MNCPLPDEIIEKVLDTPDFTTAELRGGISKQVYKVNTQTCSFILYIWLHPYDGSLTENRTEGMEYLFPDGFEYFLHNTKLLTDIGITVPKIILSGHYDKNDFDYAFVECFNGSSLDEYMKNGGKVDLYSDKIVDAMNKMLARKRGYYGSPIETVPNSISTTQLVYNFYAEELNIASWLDSKVNSLQGKILALMQKKMNEIVEIDTQEYCLVHGELTPSHIFIIDNDEIGIIDIESVKYFDFEYDWAVIDLMYGGKIPLPININMKKLEFYKICLKVGYVSVAVDFLTHVDSSNIFFKNIRKSNLQDLEMIV